MHVCMYASMHVCMLHVCMYACYVCVQLCLFECVCVYVYTCVFFALQTHERQFQETNLMFQIRVH